MLTNDALFARRYEQEKISLSSYESGKWRKFSDSRGLFNIILPSFRFYWCWKRERDGEPRAIHLQATDFLLHERSTQLLKEHAWQWFGACRESSTTGIQASLLCWVTMIALNGSNPQRPLKDVLQMNFETQRVRIESSTETWIRVTHNTTFKMPSFPTFKMPSLPWETFFFPRWTSLDLPCSK